MGRGRILGKPGTIKVRKIKAGYYEVISKRGLLAGFINKKRIGWDLSLYGIPTKNYPFFGDAKDEAVRILK